MQPFAIFSTIIHPHSLYLPSPTNNNLHKTGESNRMQKYKNNHNKFVTTGFSMVQVLSISLMDPIHCSKKILLKQGGSKLFKRFFPQCKYLDQAPRIAKKMQKFERYLSNLKELCCPSNRYNSKILLQRFFSEFIAAPFPAQSRKIKAGALCQERTKIKIQNVLCVLCCFRRRPPRTSDFELSYRRVVNDNKCNHLHNVCLNFSGNRGTCQNLTY